MRSSWRESHRGPSCARGHGGGDPQKGMLGGTTCSAEELAQTVKQVPLNAMRDVCSAIQAATAMPDRRACAEVIGCRSQFVFSGNAPPQQRVKLPVRSSQAEADGS